MNCNEIGEEGVGWIKVAQNGEQQGAVNKIVYLSSINTGIS
jgi:hypothetical protein